MSACRARGRHWSSRSCRVHPSVAAGEELFFWSNRAASRGVAEATALTPAAGRELAAEYISLLRRIGPSAARVTDKQTFNFQQLGLIHLLLPNARIIHCRRDPIDTCLSMYFTLFKGRMPFIGDKGDLAFAYQQYSRIMQHWQSVLPADCFLEVDYEKLVADREAVTRRLIDFCGLDWHRRLSAPRTQRADGDDRQLVAGPATGFYHLCSALAALRAMARRIAVVASGG